MRRLIFVFSIMLLTSLILKAQKIDSRESEVSFEIKNMRINTVDGIIAGMNGDIQFNPNDLKNSSFNVCVDPSTINTGNKKRDDHLKEEDFFHTTAYPSICILSKEIQKNGSEYKLVGTLTMRGVTKNVIIPFTYADNKFTGTLKLNRLDYNVGEDFKNFSVGYEVDIKIVCVTK